MFAYCLLKRQRNLTDPELAGLLIVPKEDKDVDYFAIQPRACYGAPLEALKALVKCPADWSARGEPDPDLPGRLAAAFASQK